MLGMIQQSSNTNVTKSESTPVQYRWFCILAKAANVVLYYRLSILPIATLSKTV
jgi:hypothetical protein